MKKLILFFGFLFLITETFSQTLSDSTSKENSTKAYYLQKSKRQKTAAWVLLGGGTVIAVVAPILAVSSDWSKPETPYDVAFFTGCASMLGSIPLFIASGRNKRKAMKASIYFVIQRNPVLTNAGFTLHSTPTLSLKLNF